jgi:hypothetical protein
VITLKEPVLVVASLPVVIEEEPEAKLAVVEEEPEAKLVVDEGLLDFTNSSKLF